jgi:ABC-type transporter Mla MlaB component
MNRYPTAPERLGAFDREDPRFEAELNWAAETALLTLHGSLEQCAVAALETQIDQVFCSPFTFLVVDLHELSTIDDIGVRCLVGLYHYVISRGSRIVVQGARGSVGVAIRNSVLTGAADGRVT